MLLPHSLHSSIIVIRVGRHFHFIFHIFSLLCFSSFGLSLLQHYNFFFTITQFSNSPYSFFINYLVFYSIIFMIRLVISLSQVFGSLNLVFLLLMVLYFPWVWKSCLYLWAMDILKVKKELWKGFARVLLGWNCFYLWAWDFSHITDRFLTWNRHAGWLWLLIIRGNYPPCHSFHDNKTVFFVVMWVCCCCFFFLVYLFTQD